MFQAQAGRTSGTGQKILIQDGLGLDNESLKIFEKIVFIIGYIFFKDAEKGFDHRHSGELQY
jgi:hypothetical protein